MRNACGMLNACGNDGDLHVEQSGCGSENRACASTCECDGNENGNGNGSVSESVSESVSGDDGLGSGSESVWTCGVYQLRRV